MDVNTRDMAFVNFNGEEMQWVKFNGVTVYEAGIKLTSSGVPPLTLLNCKGVDLVDYKIFGNDGNVGDRTRNLFNKETAEIGVGLSTSTGGTYTTDKYFTTDYIQLEIGETYSYNWKSVKWYCLYDENKNYLKYGSSTTRFTNSDASFVRFSADISELDTFQFEKSESKTSYEPYGYKIPVRTRGKNIAKPNGANITTNGITLIVNDDGTVTATGIAEKTQATVLSWCGRKNSGNNWNDFILYSKQICRTSVVNAKTGELASFSLTTQWKGVETGKTYYGNTYTTVDEPVYFSRIYSQDNLTAGENRYAGTWKIQLEVNNAITDIEPYVEPITTNIYLDEPLTTNDYLHYKKQELSKNGVITNIELPNIPTFEGTTVSETLTEILPSNMEVVYKGKEVK